MLPSSSLLAFLALSLHAPQVSSAPVEALEERAFWCPAFPYIDYTYVWSYSGETPLPAGHLVWVPTDESLILYDDDFDVPPRPAKLKARDVPVIDGVGGSQPVTRDLETRAGERAFEAKNYRDIAQQAGIFMVHTVYGLIADVGQYAGLLPPRAWAGDHIMELNIFVQWLAQNAGTLTRRTIYECDSVYNRFEGILNSHANLVGVDAAINNLKMLYLQKNGPSDPSLYPQGVYNAMSRYFTLIKPNFDGVVERLADALDDVARDQGEALVGAAWKAHAAGVFSKAAGLLAPHVNFAAQSMLGGRWRTVSVQ